MVLSIALSVVRGGEALGWFAVNQGEVLIAALEDNERRMKYRISKLSPDEGELPGGLFITHRIPKIESGLVDGLKTWLADHPDTKLIVIDTLARIRKPSPSSSYQRDSEAIGRLQRFTSDNQISLILVHHLRKSPETNHASPDLVEEVSGTTGITGSADGIFVLRRGRSQADAELLVTGRDIAEQEFTLNFDGGIWTVSGGADIYRKSAARVEIVELLQKSQCPLGPKEVAGKLGKNHQTTKNLMWKMGNSREIISCGDGTYIAIPPLNRKLCKPG